MMTSWWRHDDVTRMTRAYPPNSVTHNICGSSRGIESNSIFWFFSFFQLFCNFCNNFFVFCVYFFVVVLMIFLFRYWRHLPIHVESELIKHLSRFSLSSFSEFLMVIFSRNRSYIGSCYLKYTKSFNGVKI